MLIKTLHQQLARELGIHRCQGHREVLLLGLGGCFMSNLIAAVNARNLNVGDLKAVVRGTLEVKRVAAV